MFVVAFRNLGNDYAVLKGQVNVEALYRDRDCFFFGGRDNRPKVQDTATYKMDRPARHFDKKLFGVAVAPTSDARHADDVGSCARWVRTLPHQPQATFVVPPTRR